MLPYWAVSEPHAKMFSAAVPSPIASLVRTLPVTAAALSSATLAMSATNTGRSLVPLMVMTKLAVLMSPSLSVIL